MKEEKFVNDTETVLKFIQTYCDDKHQETSKDQHTLILEYRGKALNTLTYTLCETCTKTFRYSYERLQECPHEEKPRCRKCPSPCYDKQEWKLLATIMRYSGMKLGLTKIRTLLRRS